MKILIVGEVCTDIYVYGSCNRLSPEGPVPVLLEEERKTNLGMAGNVYKNMLSICSIEKNKNISFIHNECYEGLTKTRYIDKKTNQLLLRVDNNDNCNRINKKVIKKMSTYDCVIISDYNKGFLSNSDIYNIAKHGNISILDSKRKLSQDLVKNFTFVKVNEQEYLNNKDLANKFFQKFIVTLGAEGVLYNKNILPPNKKVETFDVAGAGDTFLAALSYMILKGIGIIKCIEFAQECCLQVIQKRGTSVYEYMD